MAEVVGLVASGISIAQLSGQLVSSGLKLKALINDIHDAPETLHALLDKLEILAQIFDELNDSFAITPSSAPLPRQGSLHASMVHCKKAADQLADLARDLSLQVESSKGPKRKLGRIRVVLKKDLLVKYEKRLESSVSLLSLSYNFSWQKLQPQIIIHEIIWGISSEQKLHNQQTNAPSPAVNASPPTFDSPPYPNRSFKAGSRIIRLGLASITGKLEVEFGTIPDVNKYGDGVTYNHRGVVDKRKKSGATLAGGGISSIRIKVRCPSWLASTIFDSVLQFNQKGWMHSLNVYRLHQFGSDERQQVWIAIEDNSVSAVEKLLQNRVFHPLDRIDLAPGLGVSVVFFVLWFNSWEVGNYLLARGSEPPGAEDSTWMGATIFTRESMTHMAAFFGHDGIDEEIHLIFLSSLYLDVNNFNAMRRRIWPDNEFFHDTFQETRLELAGRSVSRMSGNSFAPAIWRHILSPSGKLRREDLSSSSPIANMLAEAIGFSVWETRDLQRDWATVAGDVFRLLRNDRHQVGSPLSGHLWMLSSLIDELLEPSFFQLPSRRCENNKRRRTLRARLSCCDTALNIWLAILEPAGFDLLQYGHLEAEKIKSGSKSLEYPILYPIFADDQEYRWEPSHENGHMSINLLGFRYGEAIDDWGLLWSEPTDELVGEFWRSVEPAPLASMPGSWVDDDDDDE